MISNVCGRSLFAVRHSGNEPTQPTHWKKSQLKNEFHAMSSNGIPPSVLSNRRRSGVVAVRCGCCGWMNAPLRMFSKDFVWFCFCLDFYFAFIFILLSKRRPFVRWIWFWMKSTIVTTVEIDWLLFIALFWYNFPLDFFNLIAFVTNDDDSGFFW